MPGKTAKELCFETALATIVRMRNRALKTRFMMPDSTEFRYQVQWEKGADGIWRSGMKKHWRHAANSINRTFKQVQKLAEWYLNLGKPDENRGPMPKVPPDSPIQTRHPDLTVTIIGNREVVVDLKFTRANGQSDTWRPDPGQSGSRQRDDYNEINRQELGIDKDLDLSLDVNSCCCKPGTKERQKMVEPYVDPSVVTDVESPYYERPPLLGRPGDLPPLLIPGRGPIPIPVIP